MPCTAHPSPPTQATVNPSAATEPTAAAGCPPTQSTASPSVSTSVGGAAENTTPAPPSLTESRAQALWAIFDVRLLSANLYCSLADNPNPTREMVALWVGQAGQMHQHAEDAIGALVELCTELIVEVDA